MRTTAGALIAVLFTGCAHPVHIVAAPAPASQPATQPASQPVTVCIPRAVFNEMAVAVIEQNGNQNLRFVDCKKNFKLMSDDDRATHALLDDALLKLKAAAIIGPIVTAILAAASALVAHYVK